MKRLDHFPAATSRSRYPWDQVFDGNPWELVQGEDFTAKPATFIANARSQAKRRGGTVRTRTLVDSDRTAVVVQYRAGDS